MKRDRAAYKREWRAKKKREREEKEQEEQQRLKKRREQKNASDRRCRARLSKAPSTQDQLQEAENEHRLGFPSGLSLSLPCLCSLTCLPLETEHFSLHYEETLEERGAQLQVCLENLD
ncbi:putative serine/threonine-protein kinase prp4 [Balamuthia mandrillaris]